MVQDLSFNRLIIRRVGIAHHRPPKCDRTYISTLLCRSHFGGRWSKVVDREETRLILETWFLAHAPAPETNWF
ncbi:MAG: hypothetical protein GDA43_00305 [Hormoscilla sp. SP5CHS1]|nr:hypothetical protein [Hormoscilla sp. SP5CHS1]